MVDARWLEVGYRALQQIVGHVTRDYLWPLPSSDLDGIRRGPVLYRDALHMTRALLAELVDDAGERLLCSEAAMFWSEHGDRAQLVSWAACLGVCRENLEALGRWKATSSAEYVRTSKLQILNTQQLVSDAIAAKSLAADSFGEEHLLEALSLFASSCPWCG